LTSETPPEGSPARLPTGSCRDAHSRPAAAKLLLEVHDLTRRGAQDFLKAIDYGSAIEQYVHAVLGLLYNDINNDTKDSGGSSRSRSSSSSDGGVGSNGSPFSPYRRPGTRSVTVIARATETLAYTVGKELDSDHKEVHMSLDYIESVPACRTRLEVLGVLAHELVHCFQWTAHGSAPVGLVEGVADWVRLNCGLAPPHWARSAAGNWDAGYEHTGYFLDYLEERFGYGTVRQLNARLRDCTYDEKAFWPGLFGHSVLTLWHDYGEWLKKQTADAEKPASSAATKTSQPDDEATVAIETCKPLATALGKPADQDRASPQENDSSEGEASKEKAATLDKSDTAFGKGDQTKEPAAQANQSSEAENQTNQTDTQDENNQPSEAEGRNEQATTGDTSKLAREAEEDQTK
jgi:hypothetical protein